MPEVRIKIRGGTARDDEPSLCHSCKNALVIKGQNLKQEIIQCSYLDADSGGSRIRFKVSSCNRYVDFNHPSLQSMSDIAWILRTDKKKGSIGFTPVRDLKPSEREHLWDDD